MRKSSLGGQVLCLQKEIFRGRTGNLSWGGVVEALSTSVLQSLPKDQVRGWMPQGKTQAGCLRRGQSIVCWLAQQCSDRMLLFLVWPTCCQCFHPLAKFCYLWWFTQWGCLNSLSANINSCSSFITEPAWGPFEEW